MWEGCVRKGRTMFNRGKTFLLGGLLLKGETSRVSLPPSVLNAINPRRKSSGSQNCHKQEKILSQYGYLPLPVAQNPSLQLEE